MRSRQLLLLLGLLTFVGLTNFYLHSAPSTTRPSSRAEPYAPPPDKSTTPETSTNTTKAGLPILGGAHPIWQLVKDAEQAYDKKLQGQSKTLKDAVKEYRRRYGIPPPPMFDKWFDFAKSRGVQLIDEYDSIYENLTPFWGLKPSTIRGRSKEALGYNPNMLLGVLIRDGKVKTIDGGPKWQKNATQGMMSGFIKWLPDMDLAFNIHDEPRVVLPYDDISRLVAAAKEIKMPAANAISSPRNSWSERPGDVTDGSRFEDVRRTRFNIFPHQPTWIPSRLSCPPDSPSRSLEDGATEDNFASYSTGKLGFVFNQTAFSDICQSPSFGDTYGFFERPNSYNIVHDLFPIFSQSKLSSYSDIIYPSPWYWFGKVLYDESVDTDWKEKNDSMYWRGSTTGGFSRDGGWRRQHRQHLVQKLNAADQAKIMVERGDKSKEDWQVKEVPRSDYKENFDVYFSDIGQCDATDCAAQKQFFDIKDKAEQQDAWGYKYLLDMDGNAFSGRFYAFLKSKSLVYKLAVFREWHEEWLKPWIHFIPLSLRGDEWVEAVRYFAEEEHGKKEAERIANQGREWAAKALRNDDLEVWFFRLLLEYARLIDDDREIIGFSV